MEAVLQCITKGTNASQKVPADFQEKVLGFVHHIIVLREVNAYRMSDIANMDQTICRFDSPPSATNVRGARTICITTTGAEKHGFTVYLGILANGSKLPAFVVFKERCGQLGPWVKAALRILEIVLVTTTTNGWMTKEKVHHWLRGLWDVSSYSTRRLLMLDCYHPHLAEGTKKLAHNSTLTLSTFSVAAV